MIPTIYCDEQLKLSSNTFRQIVSHISSKGPKRYYEQPSHMLSSEMVNDHNIIIKCDSYRDITRKPLKILFTCSTEYINIMRILNNTSTHNKKLLQRALNTFSSRLLLIIHAILTISHDDIKYLLLQIFIHNMKNSWYIHTCAYNNGIKEMILCYAKFCGHVLYDKHNISRNIIEYVDKVDDNTQNYRELEKIMFSNDYVVDDDNKTYLVHTSYYPIKLILGQIKDSYVILFTYVINYKIGLRENTYYVNEIDNSLRSIWESKKIFYQLANRDAQRKRVQYNWNLIDDKLC